MLVETKNTGYFKPMPIEAAYAHFNNVNKNPANVYRSGYERFMNVIPKITGPNDPYINAKLLQLSLVIQALAGILQNQSWVWHNWPKKGHMLNRVVLAIDQITGAQLVLVRWNQCITPIHGHAYGMMADFLITGAAKEIDYRLVDAENRKVELIKESEEFGDFTMLSNNYYTAHDVTRGALIHQFIALTECITLHLIPEHPRDGNGNIFTL